MSQYLAMFKILEGNKKVAGIKTKRMKHPELSIKQHQQIAKIFNSKKIVQGLQVFKLFIF